MLGPCLTRDSPLGWAAIRGNDAMGVLPSDPDREIWIGRLAR